MKTIIAHSVESLIAAHTIVHYIYNITKRYGYASARLDENPTTHKCAPAAIVFVMYYAVILYE